MKRTALRRVGKSPNAALKRKLWELCREIVFLRDGKACLKCHREPPAVVVQVHHIIEKGAHPSMKFELDNLIPVCKACHRAFFHGPHKATVENWLLVTVGRVRMERLALMARARKGGYKQDLGTLFLYLEMQRDKLEAACRAESDYSQEPEPCS